MEIALPTGKPEASVRMKLLTLGALPAGGPAIAQVVGAANDSEQFYLVGIG